jgi:hypothetical protein
MDWVDSGEEAMKCTFTDGDLPEWRPVGFGHTFSATELLPVLENRGK